MIYVSCNVITTLGRHYLHDYVRPMEFDVYGLDDNGERVVLGKLCADQLQFSAVEMDGEDLLQVCDQDSAGLCDVWTALFTANGEFQPELDVQEITDNVIFLWRSVLHPSVRAWEPGILNTIGTLFGHFTVLTMWRYVTDLSDAELSCMGFRKIAKSDLIYRHVATESEFNLQHPCGLHVPLDFTPTREAQDWVEREWLGTER